MLRCHADALADLGSVPAEILHDRMRTVFHRDDTEGGHIVYNATLRAFASDRSDQSFNTTVLPRRARRDRSSRMPIARNRRVTATPYAVSRSRMM